MPDHAVRRGACWCVRDPAGDGGLVGYAVGVRYFYELVLSHDGRRGPAYRVYYPGFEPGNRTNGGSVRFRRCGPKRFNKFFSFQQIEV